MKIENRFNLQNNTEGYIFRDILNQMRGEGIRFGIPKGGLWEDPRCGNYLVENLGWQEKELNRFKSRCYTSESTLMKGFLIRQKDIVKALEAGNLDFGILGADTVLENQLEGGNIISIGEPLVFGECMFRLGFPDGERPEKFEQITQTLERGRIATSLPNTLRWVH